MPLLGIDAELTEEAQRTMADDGEVIRDERLRLVLLCAHPSLSAEAGAALTLRLVLGVTTEDIARLFLVSRATMAARLTRARQKLAGASFDVPGRAEFESRIASAASVAYLAFTSGYAPGSGADVHRADLAGEAIRLLRVIREVAAKHPDLDALLALMLLQHSRRDARVAGGDLVTLPDQDRSRWRPDEIGEALDLLGPLVSAPVTPWLLEALIAAEHAVAPTADTTSWLRISGYYRELEDLTGSPVVRLNRAVAVAECDGPLPGLALLEGLALPGHRLPSVRAELLHRAGRTREARTELDHALALVDNDAERRFLARRLSEWTA